LPKDRPPPHTTAETDRAAAAKRARLAAELRANLTRRKAQGRERVAPPGVAQERRDKDGGTA